MTAFDPTRLGALSAALRHVRDAETLLRGAPAVRSLDNAWHLAGFAPECARKAVLSGEWLDKAIGHGVTNASETAVAFALAHEPRARRYGVHEYARLYPEFSRWNVSDRYQPTGTAREDQVRPLVEAARRCVDAIVLAAWTEGGIPRGFSW